MEEYTKKHEHRGIDFYYIEWKTWNDKDANGYICKNERLLSGLNLIQFGMPTKYLMKQKINDLLDYKHKYLEDQEQYDKAAEEYMSKIGTKGDG